MATWKDLSNFTYGELREMQLTYQDLRELSMPELLNIAQKKLERFKISKRQDTPVSLHIISVLEAAFAGVAANLATDMVRSVEWKQLLLSSIELLNQLMD